MDDFKPLFEYVEKNIENKMGLKELTGFMGYSPFYISRKFMDFTAFQLLLMCESGSCNIP